MVFIILQSLSSKFGNFVTTIETRLDDEEEVFSLENLSRLLLKNEGNLEYLRARSFIPAIYLKICLTTLRCSTYGFYMNHAIRFTAKIISGLEIVKYRRLPINCL